MKAEKIDIAFCDPGYVSGYFAVSLAATTRDMEYHDCMGKLHREQGSLLSLSRNLNVQKFLDGDANWLWMVDADMIFDVGHPMKLWEVASETGAKMVSGLAFIFRNGEQPVPSVFYPSPDDPDVIGLIENYLPDKPTKVAATGLASALVHREVFEALGEDGWFDMVPRGADGKPTGEDVGFFLKARDAGFDLILNPDAETWHIKEIALGREQFTRFWELRGVNADNRK